MPDDMLAFSYLNDLHAQFHDWRLAIVAYDIGQEKTQQLIQQTGSRDPWMLAHSPQAPHELAVYLAMWDAALFFVHEPQSLT